MCYYFLEVLFKEVLQHMDKNISFYKLNLILSTVIFGSIGIFRRYIPISSGLLAMLRGIVGAIFIFIIVKIKGKKIDTKSIKNNLLLLITSGALIGFNWILLFESYRYTDVSTATLCYYMAPIFVIFLSPIFLKEKLSLTKILCIFVALIGMFFISNITTNIGFKSKDFKGMIFGLGAALLYAIVIMLNQKFKKIEAFDKTIVQLGAAGLVLIPYSFIFKNNLTFSLNYISICLIIIVCIIHTGVAYYLYFNSMKKLSSDTVAFYSYIDPIVALVLSSLILKETMSINEIIGAILILGATFISEIKPKKFKDKK